MSPDVAELSSPFDGMQQLGRDESLQLLRDLAVTRGAVGRVAYVRAGRPILRPVTYAADDTGVVIRTHEESGLLSAVGGTVCFEVDDLEPALHAGWSVIVTGSLERVSSEGATVAPWASGSRNAVLRISLDEVTGLRIVPARGGVQRSGR